MPFSIAVDATDVYWTNIGSPSSAMRCAKTGCGDQPTVVAALGGDRPNGIALDASTVYIATSTQALGGGLILACPLSGCAGQPKQLASGLSEPVAVAVDAARVYWADLADQTLRSCPLTGCVGAPDILGSMLGYVGSLAIDATNAYMTTLDAILVCPLAGCGTHPTMLATKQNQPFSIAVDGASVYWPDPGAGPAFKPRILKCAIGGCNQSPTVVADGQVGPKAVAVDGTRVYWTDSPLNAVPGDVSACPLAGCTGAATRVFTGAGLMSPSLLAVDATSVFWTDSLAGTINALPK
jgi:hypothetical protein